MAEMMALWRSSIATRRFVKLIHLSGYEKKYRKGNGFPFYLSPDPLLRILPYLRASNNPPPPGVGGAGGVSGSPWRA